MKCSRVRKAECVGPNCKWIAGKGCKRAKPKSLKRSKRASKPKSLKRKSKNMACYKLRKAECKGPDCKWVVGKGCKRTTSKKRSPTQKKAPSPKFLGQQVLQFFDHPIAEITQIGDCLQDIIVENYLARGAFGAVYAIQYKGKECVMKIVVEKPVNLSGIRKIQGHRMVEAKKEANWLRKASDLGIGPKLYDFRICEVEIPFIFGNEKVKIGVFILERLKMTLYSYYQSLIDKLIKMKQSKNFEKQLLKADLEVQSINEKIREDCILAQKNGLGIFDMHTENIMITKDNVPIISDWGVAGQGNEADCEMYFDLNIMEWHNMVKEHLHHATPKQKRTSEL